MRNLEIEYPNSRNMKRRTVLSREQQEYLIGAIRRNLGYESLGYALSLYTGMRIGELCALQWGDFDLERGNVIIRKNLQRIRNEGIQNGPSGPVQFRAGGA